MYFVIERYRYREITSSSGKMERLRGEYLNTYNNNMYTQSMYTVEMRDRSLWSLVNIRVYCIPFRLCAMTFLFFTIIFSARYVWSCASWMIRKSDMEYGIIATISISL